MKIKVNSKIIKSLLPCEDRLVNYLKHYNKLNVDILEFLALDKITAKDKIWVSVRLMPRGLVEAFAIDCAIKARISVDSGVSDSRGASLGASDAAYYASYAASYASYAAGADRAARAASDTDYYAAANLADYAAKASLEDSIDALAYLIKGNK